VKAQCDHCKEIVPLEFEVAASGIDVTCGACGARYQVPATAATAAAPPSVPLPSGDMVCPKCQDAQPPAAACRRCGLVQEKWRRPSPLSPAGEGAPATREGPALWEACVARWEDPAAHEAFLDFCRRTGEFAFAAARYRAALKERGGRDAVAEDRLRQVRSLAELTFLRPSRRTGDGATQEGSPYKNTVLILTVGLALLGAGFIYLLLTHH